MTRVNVYLPFYFDWARTISKLSDSDYGKLMRSVMDFAMSDGEADMPEGMSEAAEMAYDFIISTIKRATLQSTPKKTTAKKQVKNREKAEYRKKSTEEQKSAEDEEKRQEENEKNGKMRDFSGKSPTSEGENRNLEQLDTTRVGKDCKSEEHCATSKDYSATSQDNSATLRDNYDTFYEYSAASKDNSANLTQKCTPTLCEVQNYFKERNFGSNPDEFFNFYESNGWMVGQNPMRNWYSSAENWEIKAQRAVSRGDLSSGYGRAKNTDTEPRRYGDFDVHEAFQLALERSYADLDEEDDDGNL